MGIINSVLFFFYSYFLVVFVDMCRCRLGVLGTELKHLYLPSSLAPSALFKLTSHYEPGLKTQWDSCEDGPCLCPSWIHGGDR